MCEIEVCVCGCYLGGLYVLRSSSIVSNTLEFHRKRGEKKGISLIDELR